MGTSVSKLAHLRRYFQVRELGKILWDGQALGEALPPGVISGRTGRLSKAEGDRCPNPHRLKKVDVDARLREGLQDHLIHYT
jgi:hypothetical protein